MIILNVPTFVILPRKTKADKKVNCNLNEYRNLNFRVLSAAKNAFYDAFEPEMKRIKPEFDNYIELLKAHRKGELTFRLSYCITAKDKRKFDIANFLPIIQKYADDCLVKYGYFRDDDWSVITEVNYNFGGVTGSRDCFLHIEVI